MKKSFKLRDLDCANCASKIETAVKKISGVESASVNFMMQRLTLEAADKDFERVLSDVRKTVRKVEPDCTIIL